jgi:hypothetical protein
MLAEIPWEEVEDRYKVDLTLDTIHSGDLRLFGAHSAILASACIREFSVHRRYSATTSASKSPSLIPAGESVRIKARKWQVIRTCQCELETPFRPLFPFS